MLIRTDRSEGPRPRGTLGASLSGVSPSEVLDLGLRGAWDQGSGVDGGS